MHGTRTTWVLMSPFALLGPPSVAVCHGAEFDGVQAHTLDNGLRVLLLEEHRAPTAVFQIWYRVGSRNEPREKAGISHLLEHMMFRGTERYGPKAFSRIVQRNGGSHNAFTSHDSTAYVETLASDRIGRSPVLEADRMRNLVVEGEAFRTERKVVMEERRLRAETGPEAAFAELTRSVAFQLHPYRHPVIGWMQTLQNITVEDLRGHHRTHYVPNNAVVVVVGDIDAEAMLAEIRSAFGRVPSNIRAGILREQQDPAAVAEGVPRGGVRAAPSLRPAGRGHPRKPGDLRQRRHRRVSPPAVPAGRRHFRRGGRHHGRGREGPALAPPGGLAR